ncbi:MAG: glycosyltransferase family 39 protein [Phycisphaeraceae bacterium]|nr:glycosyltransferase family 39 protein [Phycisphaeraceae bacterium]
MSGTEGHRALTAHQMVTRGDWLTPHLWDNVYLRKPPLQYWFIAILEVITGQTGTWIWRLPAVLCSALLGGIIVRFTSRHAGGIAGWCSGLAYVCLIPLWLQSRAADIDAANTFFSVLGALALVELQDPNSSPRQNITRMALVFLGTSATLMLKAQAAMPIIVAAWIGPWLMHRKINRKPWDWRLWAPILLGVLPLAIWMGMIYQQFQNQIHMADTRGLSEMANNVTGQIVDYFRALLLPVQLFAFSLPISLCLMRFPNWLAKAHTPQTNATTVCRNLFTTILFATLIYVLTATHNPRYGYPILPLLCPIAGIMLKDWMTGQLNVTELNRFTKIIGIFLWSLVILHAVLAGMLIWQHGVQVLLILSVIIAFISAVKSEIHLRRKQSGRSLIFLAVTLASLTIPISENLNFKKQRGGYMAAAALIEETQTEPEQIVLARKVAYDQPELFYYAGRSTSALPRDIQTLLQTYTQATLVLHASEYDVMGESLAPYITSKTTIDMHGKTRLWVVKINAKQTTPALVRP